MSARLTVTNLSAGYGSATNAIDGVDLVLGRGQAVGVLGANGAGKSTLLRALAGLLPHRAGSIVVDGTELRPSETPPSRLRRGIVLLPEGHRVIGTLTVEENLRLASISSWPRGSRSQAARVLPRVFELFPALADRRSQLAGYLSGGEQQMVSLGRALMSEPRVLLLDEPSLGLAPVIIERIYDTLADLRTNDLSLLVVEQNHERLTTLCDEVHVLRLGRLVASMDRAEVTADALRAAYFGGSTAQNHSPE